VASFEVLKRAGESAVELPNGRQVRFWGRLEGAELFLRSRIDGDRLEGKKIKDMFNSRKVDLFDRDRAVVILENGRIIWVEYLSEDVRDIEMVPMCKTKRCGNSE
jgi:tRNA(Ile)-lysidine synthetase-like protein